MISIDVVGILLRLGNEAMLRFELCEKFRCGSTLPGKRLGEPFANCLKILRRHLIEQPLVRQGVLDNKCRPAVYRQDRWALSFLSASGGVGVGSESCPSPRVPRAELKSDQTGRWPTGN